MKIRISRKYIFFLNILYLFRYRLIYYYKKIKEFNIIIKKRFLLLFLLIIFTFNFLGFLDKFNEFKKL